MDHIGEHVRKLRKGKGLTLTQLAGNHLSAAMVSLIENGKTKPTVETLQHIAKKLDVDAAELMGEMNRKNLRDVLYELQELYVYGEAAFQKVIKRIKQVLPKLSHNYESARIYEWYAKVLFFYYEMEPYAEKWVIYGDWHDPAIKAKEIYELLQMDENAIKIELFLIRVEYSQAHYQKTLELIESLLDKMESYEDSRELIRNNIHLKSMQSDAESGLGNSKKALQIIDEAIKYSKETLVFDYFYNLHNTAVLLHYNEGRNNEAREHLEQIEKFIELTENNNMYTEKMLIQAHYQEFFENNPTLSLETCEQLEGQINSQFNLSPELLKGYQEHINDQKARCYTKLKQPNQALPLFHDQLRSMFVKDHPMDRSLRDITYSYRAYCYHQLGDTNKAMTEAEKAVESLKTYPHTQYYQFAREVLKEVQQLV
ncbi:helix-turn-helix domain-containing protein [Tenuibacillus multivorans]|uniref:Transcriptional regulator, contains XRE-family HTH domain n=1 Tax=Tenuibacillus multivorans TaxID=237069 RepID=A0A1H0APQ4_9BACI|nr:helix-turn-helix transcriptional regulator [Tenuibacillus multivorans]GEL78227.1 hypothetical protein TMU01_24620 [Tenuibacillus multivorans]SDN35334.1 Transcriptional regulator, contains XRE-family HTH domain [Tenuibacillus multivorans]